MQAKLFFLVAAACAACAGFPSLAMGQLSHPDFQQLPDQIRAARNSFRPVTEADLLARRSAVQSAAAQLDPLLRANANALQWRRFLRFDEMQQELAKGTRANPELLDEIQAQYISGYEGLELPVIANVGRALRRYSDALATYQDREAREHYQDRIDALAQSVEEYLQNPDEANHAHTGAILGEIAAAGQVADVVRKVRRLLSNPNLQAEIGESLIAAGFADPVNDVGPVNDVILGTRICGTAHTVGYLSGEMGNTPHHGAIDILLLGTAYSNTVGRNGPAIIHSTGVTGLAGRKRLVIDANGVRALPAASNAQTSTTINGIDVTSRFAARLVQKIATRRVYESKSQAEAIGAQRAAARLNRRMDTQSANLVAQANRDFWDKFRNPLTRVGAFPEQLHFASLDDRLTIRGVRADSYQLGAPTSPPQLREPTDLSVRVHESLINNSAATVLAGRTLLRDEVHNLAERITGEVPEELTLEDERDWSITFEAEQPILVRFRDDGFVVSIRGDSYTSDDREYDAMHVTARYKLEPNGQGGIRAIRQGDLEIYPPGFEPGKDRLSAAQQSLRSILERRFGKMFKPELPDEPSRGLELGGRFKKLGPLPVALLRSRSGWLSLGWNRAKSSTRLAQTPR